MSESPVVLLTGASSGTGLYAAVEMARRGARVYGTTRDPARADALRAACRDADIDVTVVVLDVRSDASVRDAVATVIESAGRLDVLVNNAAAFAFASVEFTTPEEVLTMVDTNLVGPIRMIQAVLPVMRAQRRGRIVNVGSVSAEPKFGIPLNAVYGATKSGLAVLSLDINKELQPLGIDVVLCEGGIGGRSAMFERLHDGVAAFGQGDGVYGVVEGWGRGFANVLDQYAADSSASGAIVADACLAQRADLRHPRDAQEPIDAAHAISDEHYLQMCRGEEVHRLVERLGPFASAWTAGRSI